MNRDDYAAIVERALLEDLSDVGDVTTNSVIDPTDRSRAELRSRSSGVVAGLDVAACVFEMVNAEVSFQALTADGDRVDPGLSLAVVEGDSRSILTSERTALNLLGRMSGVATATAALVDSVEGTGVLISDTRKTMPGLRVLDKYAVMAGGGVNHRMGLYDAVLIKDNHIAAAGDIRSAVESARQAVGPDVLVEVEVDDLDQLKVVLTTGADRVLLDNMDLDTLRTAVEMAGDAITTEASGGVTVESVRPIAETGVDIISVGWITHSPPQLDIGLDFVS
jgi:nicotinate-nucleotide pyrophosphorylase (carboxylating)